MTGDLRSSRQMLQSSVTPFRIISLSCVTSSFSSWLPASAPPSPPAPPAPPSSPPSAARKPCSCLVSSSLLASACTQSISLMSSL